MAFKKHFDAIAESGLVDLAITLGAIAGVVILVQQLIIFGILVFGIYKEIKYLRRK